MEGKVFRFNVNSNKKEDSFDLNIQNNNNTSVVWKLCSYKDKFLLTGDSYGRLNIIDVETFQFLATAKDYNSSLTNIVVINN